MNYNTMCQAERRIAREEYARVQNGKCYHCAGDLTEPPSSKIRLLKIDWKRFPPNFLKHPIHLHHDHKTGETIGAVHARCNAVLWQYHGE